MVSVIAGPYRLEHRIETDRWGDRWLGRRLAEGRWEAVQRLVGWYEEEQEVLSRTMALTDRHLPHVLSYGKLIPLPGSEDGGTSLLPRPELLVQRLPSPREHTWSLREAAAVVRQVCKGLEAIRACSGGFMHGWVTLESVWTDALGHIRIDGCRLGAAEAQTASRMGMGRVRRSFHDMAPEVVRGNRPDLSADVYQLGVLLYQLSTGRRPFQAESEFGTLEAILSGACRRPGEVVPGFDPALEALIAEALQLDPTRRPLPGVWSAALEAWLGPPSPDEVPLTASGADALDWLREHLFEELGAVAAWVQLRPDLTGDPVVSDYVERHVLGRVREALEASRAPTLEEAWLLGRFEPGEHALARWRQDPTLPKAGRWIASWLAGDEGCELPDTAVAAFVATALPTTPTKAPAAAVGVDPSTPVVHIGPVQLAPCDLAWDSLEPVPDRGDAVRHCRRCEQQVTRVETLEGLIRLAGSRCTYWNPGAPEPAPRPIVRPSAPTVVIEEALVEERSLEDLERLTEPLGLDLDEAAPAGRAAGSPLSRAEPTPEPEGLLGRLRAWWNRG